LWNHLFFKLLELISLLQELFLSDDLGLHLLFIFLVSEYLLKVVNALPDDDLSLSFKLLLWVKKRVLTKRRLLDILLERWLSEKHDLILGWLMMGLSLLFLRRSRSALSLFGLSFILLVLFGYVDLLL
jgi:hypothetical protein